MPPINIDGQLRILGVNFGNTAQVMGESLAKEVTESLSKEFRKIGKVLDLKDSIRDLDLLNDKFEISNKYANGLAVILRMRGAKGGLRALYKDVDTLTDKLGDVRNVARDFLSGNVRGSDVEKRLRKIAAEITGLKPEAERTKLVFRELVNLFENDLTNATREAEAAERAFQKTLNEQTAALERNARKERKALDEAKKASEEKEKARQKEIETEKEANRVFQNNIDRAETKVKKQASKEIDEQEKFVQQGIAYYQEQQSKRQAEIESNAAKERKFNIKQTIKDMADRNRGEKQYQRALEQTRGKQAEIKRLLDDIARRTRETGGKFQGNAVQRASLKELEKFASADPTAIAKSKVSGAFDKVGLKEATANTKAFSKELQQFEAHAFTLDKFSKLTALALKRYSAFLTGAGVIFFLTANLRRASDAALEFERSATKIQQVLNITNAAVKPLEASIKRLATTYGVSSREIAEGVFFFAQSGVQDLKQLETIAKELAKIPLSATFDDIKSTSEGLIAVFGQFNKTAAETGEILDIVNQFSADFAAESSDIFEAVKRGGAAFSAVGGSFEDFVALFSVLRESTRESAATLGTFFKSGLAQILQPSSQKELEQLRITSENTIDQLVELSDVLYGPDSAFSGKQRLQITRELTGQRQFARLVALLRELQDPSSQKRVKQALLNASGSFDRSIQVRLDDIGVSLGRVREQFNKFISDIFQDQSIKSFIKSLSDLSIVLIKILDITKPLIPLIATLGTLGSLKLGTKLGTSVLQQYGVIGASNQVANFIKNPSFNQAIDFTGDLTDKQFPAYLRNSGNPLAIQTRIDRLNRVNAGRGAKLPAMRLGSGGIFGNRLGTIGRATLAGGGAFLAGEVLQSTAPDDVRSTQGAIGRALSAGALGGLGAASFAPFLGPAAPVVIGVTALTAATISVIKSIDNANKSIEQFRLNVASDPGQRIDILSENLIKLSNQSRSNVVVGPAAISGFDTTAKFSLAEEIGKLSQGDELGAELLNQVNTQIFDKARKNAIKILEASGNRNSVSAAQFNKVLNQEIVKQLTQRLRRTEIGVKLGDKLEAAVTQFVTNNVKAELIKQQRENLALRGQDEIELGVNAKAFSDASRVAYESLNEFNKGLQDVNTTLANLRLDNNAVINAQAGSREQILSQFGNIPLSLDNSINDIVKGLNSFVRQNEDIIRVFLDSREGTEAEVSDLDSIRGLAEALFGDGQFDQVEKDRQKFIDEYGKIFAPLLAFDVKVEDLFKNLLSNTDIRGIVEGLLPKQINDAIESAYKELLNTFNAELQAREALFQALQSATDKILGLESTITASGDIQADRTLAFNNVTQGSQISTMLESAVNASNRSQRSQVSETVQQLIQRTQFLTTQRKSFEGAAPATISSLNDLDLIRNANLARQYEIEALNLVNRKIDEFNTRIGDAEKATDILTTALNTYKSQLASAGSAVIGFTEQDLKSGFDTFGTFLQQGKNGTTLDINAGLRGFDPQMLQDLLRTLGAVGSFDIGGGISGNDLTQRIQEEFGIPFLSKIVSQFQGISFEDAEKQIREYYKKLEEERKQAKAEEDALRADQRELLKLQLELARAEKARLEDQKKAIDSASGSIDDLGQYLIDNITKAFTDAFNDDSLALNTQMETMSRIMSDMSGTTQQIADALETINSDGIKTDASLTVQPIQVNVALTAPDILAVAGPQIKEEIVNKITSELSKVFEDQPEKASAIKNIRST